MIALDHATGFIADPVLEHRDTLLSNEAMAVVLGEILGRNVISVSKRRVKYRVGQSIRVLYDVETADGHDLVALRGFAGRAIPQTLASRPDTLQIPDLTAAAWLYPNDRKLTALASFVSNPSATSNVLGFEVDHLKLMAYAPEKHATIRCDSGDTALAFAKLYAGSGHVRSARIHRVIGASLATVGIKAPTVLLVDAAIGLVLLSPVEGVEYASAINHDGWRELGIATAALHSIDDPGCLPRFERLSIESVKSAAEIIAAVRPDVADACRKVVIDLEATVGVVAGADQVVLHGDLHAKNAIVDNGAIGFVDLDQASIGPAAADLGSAAAAMRYRDIVDGFVWAPSSVSLSASAATPGVASLLAGYGSSGKVPTEDQITWFTAAALIAERALRAVNRVRMDGLKKLPDVVADASRVLSEGIGS